MGSIPSFNDVTYNSNNSNNNGGNKKLQFIVIGAGLIGPRHADHIVSRPDCQLLAIVDHSAKGPLVSKQFNTRLFKNLTELFEFCEFNNEGVTYPDAAIIATPNHTHVDLGLQLASKGIHLLVEKPLAPTAEDCKTLVDYCHSKNIHLLIGHHRRFNPYIITTKKNLKKLGHLVAIQGTWTLCKPPSYFLEKPWRSSLELGGGTLLINLIHDLDLLQYLLGPIEKVYAELLSKQRIDRFDNHNNNISPNSIENSNLVDEGAALTLKFANGCCGTFICSDNVTSPFSFEVGTGENPTVPFNEEVHGFYRIFGSHGTISVPDMKLYHQKDNEFEDDYELINNSMSNNFDDARSWLKPIVTEQLKMDHEEEDEDNELDIDMENTLLPTPSPSPNYKEYSPIHNSTRPTESSSTTTKTKEKPKPFDLQLDHFVNIITGKESYVKCTGEDALQALLCIEAVMKSIQSGLPQFVKNIDQVQPNNELLNEYKN
ncbi:putative oxidoreductase [Scheffersomyces amazonensis]|uniref:putative oxidoreductase n=1 Tax=Scheffersomyces amazonensis TaxID=1078765 RepID=UPI00315D3AD0